MRGRPVSTHCAHCGVKFDEGETAKVDQRAICVKCEVLRKWEMNHKSRHPDSSVARPPLPTPPPRRPRRPLAKHGARDVYFAPDKESCIAYLVNRISKESGEERATSNEERSSRYERRAEDCGPPHGFAGAGEEWHADGVRYGPVRK